MGRRGRPPKPGKVYYLGRLRFRPGIDPPELKAFLDLFDQAEPGRKASILRAALLGGLDQGQVQAAQVEDEETAALLDDLLGEF